MERASETIEDELIDPLAENGPDRIVYHLEYQEQAKSKRSLPRFDTGLNHLDALMQGFRPTELTVITGPTGNGKTLFADTVGMRLMRNCNMSIAWFSFEVSTEQMLDKYSAASDAEQLGLYVPLELKPGSLAWLKRKCAEAQAKYNCQAFFIDHLHFLVDMNTKTNMSLNIGAVLRHIKHDIAKGLNAMVFLICHQGQLKNDEEPSLENIRDSSFIAQESDNVFVVYRSPDPLPEELQSNGKIKGYPRTYDGGFATVKIEKARRSGTFRKRIAYQKIGSWLEEAIL